MAVFAWVLLTVAVLAYDVAMSLMFKAGYSGAGFTVVVFVYCVVMTTIVTFRS